MSIEKDTFKNMSVDSKLEVLFDIGHSTHERVMKLEKRKVINTVASAAGGVAGGFLATWSYVKLKVLGS